jgi:large subunit ribosomal protein L11
MKVKLIVDGGSMKPGPAVSQQLGPMGINLGKVIEDTNKATSGFKGMKVPVEIEINPQTKEFTIIVSSPPTSELIKKELKLEKGSAKAGTEQVGNLAIEQVIAIAKTKMPDMLAKNIEAAVKLVVGSCVSLGVMVENKNAKEIIIEIESGAYSNEIKEERTEVSSEKKKDLDLAFSDISAKQEAAAKEEEEAKAAKESEKAETVEEKAEENKDSKDSKDPAKKNEK